MMENSVKFVVRVTTAAEEFPCIVGNHSLLGNWNAYEAKQLQREDVNSDVWTTVLSIPSDSVQYRYCVCQMLHTGQKHVRKRVVKRWESIITPRCRYLSANKKESDVPIDEFGFSDGSVHISQGWLIEQTEIQLHLMSNSLTVLKKSFQNRSISVKCTPVIYHPDHEETDCDDANGVIEERLWTDILTYSLNTTKCTAQKQDSHGELYNPAEFLAFKTQTFCPEKLEFRLTFYLQDKCQEFAQHIGSAYVSHLQLGHTEGTHTYLIVDQDCMPVARIAVSHLIIKPLVEFGCTMEIAGKRENFQYMACREKPALIGHRGMGCSFGIDNAAPIQENTVASFTAALNHGVDYVEMDAIITSDHKPVVFHDFQVYVKVKSKNSVKKQYKKVAVKDLTFEELQSMELYVQDKNAETGYTELSREDDENNLEVVPPLEKCLRQLDPSLGFIMDIKQAMPLLCGDHEQRDYFDRNINMDKILEPLLQYGGKRKIILTCFDPNAAILLQKKQNRYPVCLITMAMTGSWPPYKDERSWSIENAVHLAKAEELAGISAHTEEFLKDPSLIPFVKESELLFITWGVDNNKPERYNQFIDWGFHGIILDRIDQWQQGYKQFQQTDID